MTQADYFYSIILFEERSGSVVECLSQNRGVVEALFLDLEQDTNLCSVLVNEFK